MARSQDLPHSTGRMLADIRRKTFHKECLHPEASLESCTNKIIDAHSIQKNGPLKFIKDDTNHVYKFGQDSNGNDDVVKIGWLKASTFKGFCGKHDKEMFSSIEDAAFLGTPFQCFVAGYRVYALEYFKKISVIKGLPFMKDNLDRGVSDEEQINIQRMLSTMNQGFLKGVDDFKETLEIYTKHHNENNFNAFKSISIYFTGDLSVVVGGAFAPDFSINGKRLQNLSTGVKLIENISVSTLVGDKEFAIVFSWPKRFSKCTDFANSLAVVNREVLPSRLIEIIFSYIENTYFSKKWLSGLSCDARSRIETMARNPIQYGQPVKFSNTAYTNWKVDRIVHN